MSKPKTFPHFLGIGAQKAGTSWLHECLKKHPELWLPPEKELHYFDRNPAYASPNFLYPDQPIQRLFGKDPWNQVYRDRCKNVFKDNLGNKEVFHWYVKYFLLPASDDWYASLFEAGREKIRGEITPAYSILDEADVSKVQALMPDCKIIFILRNPIERAWSQFRFMVRDHKMNRESSFDEFQKWVESPEQSDRSAYLRTIDRWENAFSKKQVLICFYDDIVTQPENLLVEILDFLGASSDSTTIGTILQRGRVNVSPEIDMPANFQQFLHERYHNDLIELEARFGGPTKLWLEKSLVS